MTFRLASVALPEQGQVDIDVDGRLVAAITPAGTTPCIGESFNLHGHVVSSSFAEPHAHLDKAFLADRIQNPTGDLLGAIQGLEAVRDSITFHDIVNSITGYFFHFKRIIQVFVDSWYVLTR